MTDDQVLKTKAIFLSVLAVLAGLVFLSLDWAPRIEFDITGFLWVLGNLGRVAALVAFLTLAGAAMTFWLRLYREC